ncbi:alkaline phosphatase D family protein [Jiangella mangrovi]|uniref:Alkaline phosphatase D n=1 Tax=Jiangella mangrovi TaxID=1524084 RepID=A0A7W9GMP0_9ACTN|nr:alkaline phosphatase D family protein [Jiangella mangrovi]MBB5786503.1 alkaline phosphatase D [Jiangella mangrovi]
MSHGPLLGRRQVLAGAGALATIAFVPTLANADERILDYPFTLGVSSGDPLPDGVVLWTRLAPQPLEPNGGMTSRSVPVRWQVSETESFRRLVRQGVDLAKAEDAHTVHVDVRGLKPHRWYYYRFIVGGDVSPVGRTRTAPAPGTTPPVSFAFASCSNWEQGYFTAYRHLAGENPDVVFHLGDYLYEGQGNPNALRSHVGREIQSLDDYRRRHAQYRTDPDLQAAHLVAPWIVTWDDHEVDNNYAALLPTNTDSNQGNGSLEDFTRRRAAAYKAYWEHMPLRADRRAVGADLPLYRGFTYGDTARFSVLDTRQYRTNQPCNDTYPAMCGGDLDPSATILGSAQATWLEQQLGESTAVWNVVPQQVLFANLDLEAGGAIPGDDRDAGLTDAWDGYRASRQRLMDYVVDREVENFVVLTGDIHAHFMSDLRQNFENESSPVIGTELVCTSITSGGNGTDLSSYYTSVLPENPHLRYNSNRRGYVSCRLDRDTYEVDYRILDQVSTPGAPLRTGASYVIEAGNPGAQEA